MKYLTAILFLSILLFNLFGYRLVIHYLHARSTVNLVAQIDNRDYKEEELISIKTPLSLPYYTNSETYERVNGVVSIEGEYYNYVKRRVFNDSLELLCLPNAIRAKLDKIEVEYSKAVSSDSTTERNNKKAVELKTVLPEYFENSIVYVDLQPVNIDVVKFSSYTYHISPIDLAVISPPPDVMQYRA
jgi:hypothetical protein